MEILIEKSDKIILSLIAIGTTISFYSIIESHILGCDLNLVNTSPFCPLSINAWDITANGYELVGDHAPFLLVIDVFRISPILHFILSFLGWLLYVFDLKLKAAFVIALAHVNGWIVLVAFVSNQDKLNIIGPMLTSEAFVDLTYRPFGLAIVSSTIASSIQLLTVLVILLKTFIGKEN